MDILGRAQPILRLSFPMGTQGDSLGHAALSVHMEACVTWVTRHANTGPYQVVGFMVRCHLSGPLRGQHWVATWNRSVTGFTTEGPFVLDSVQLGLLLPATKPRRQAPLGP